MWILPLVGYTGIFLGFLFLTLAIASGLYYLSELVEEHSVFTKKLLTRMIYTIIGLQFLLWLIDGFPLGLSALGIFSHVIYAQNLRRFPIVKLTDPLFLLSCVLVILNHYIWFRHFSTAPTPAPSSSYSPYSSSRNDYPTFTEISSFFGLCVWLVPFSLFVSLSAGENILPSMGSEYATGEGSSYLSPGREPGSAFGMGSGIGGLGSASGMGMGMGMGSSSNNNSSSSNNGGGSGGRKTGRARSGTNTGMAKAVVNGVREWVGETGEVMGFWKGEKTRKF